MHNDTPIRYLPTNQLGKDYIVGDLHGCFELLDRLLKAVHFDKNKDRLFSVGDLADRGPDSLRCIQLLDEAWFYAVQGNHELMMLDFFRSYLLQGCIAQMSDIDDTGFLDYGGAWVKDYFLAESQRMTAEFDRCLGLILNLPLVYIIGEGEHRFHVIHGDLVRPNENYSSAIRVWLDRDIDTWFAEQSIPSTAESSLYWGRTLMLSPLVDLHNGKMQSGLSPTFCGHTPRSKVRLALSHVCIDTGAFVSLRPAFYRISSEEFGLTLFDFAASSWVFGSYQQEELVWGEVI
jgi:serine/threonine protein phosphatase 1